MPRAIFENVEVNAGGKFEVAVVGESFYQEALVELDKGRRALGEEVAFDACLLAEPGNPHDANAVKVLTTEVKQIGYLSREDALRYKPIVQTLLACQRFLSCPARLIGGTGPDRPSLGVLLDLPAPAAIQDLARRFVPGVLEKEAAGSSSTPEASLDREWRSEVVNDPMDGTVYQTRWIPCLERFAVAKGKQVIPRLVIRAKRPNLTSCILDSYVLFGPSFLPRRKVVAVRWRLDENAPVSSEWNSATSKDALFPSGSTDEKVGLIFALRSSARFYFETERKDGSRCLCQFELGKVNGEVSGLLSECGIRDADLLCSLHPAIADHLLRMGPKQTILTKETLKATGLYAGPIDEEKARPLFEGARSFAESAHVAELFGPIEDRKGFLGLSTKRHFNDPFSVALYNKAPSRIRQQLGPLKLYD